MGDGGKEELFFLSPCPPCPRVPRVPLVPLSPLSPLSPFLFTRFDINP
ncbi:MAG: hypothetical protein KME31_08235 [Tolypothrix carrinoi HA7290-LM1]|nr:hypothetical protein [Tolypothrix carrinoi HA7290-LM1]